MGRPCAEDLRIAAFGFGVGRFFGDMRGTRLIRMPAVFCGCSEPIGGFIKRENKRVIGGEKAASDNVTMYANVPGRHAMEL
jgi:hypothetical protein